MRKPTVPQSGTPLILFIVLVVVFLWMLISFSSFTVCAGFAACGYFILPSLVGLVACVCGVCGILFAHATLMLATAVLAALVVVLDVVAIIVIFAQFTSALAAFAWTLIVFFIAAICWASIAFTSWQLRMAYMA
jgi:hypothetical protein